jgi:ribosomal protein S15P/S13E
MNRRRNPLAEILEDPNKGVNKTYGEVGSLARLFRTILSDLNIGGYQFTLLMTKFLNDPRNHIPDNKKDQTSNRGNLNKEFQKDTMTWKVFCKALRFLQFTRFRIIIQAERADGATTQHQVEVNLALSQPDTSEYDDDYEETRPSGEEMPYVPYLDFDPDVN